MDKKKRIMSFNMDKLEKENKPNELKSVFKGAEQEKIKAIKGGKKVLKKNADVLQPREGFKPGEKVIIQEHSGRKEWIDTGVIEQARISDDGSNQSFLITLDRGGSCLRNKRFIKHWRDTTPGTGRATLSLMLPI